MMFVLIGLYALSLAALTAMVMTRRVANRRGLSAVRVALTWDERTRMESYPIEVRSIRWLLTAIALVIANAVLIVLTLVPTYVLAAFLSVTISVLTVTMFACLYAGFCRAESERRQRWACVNRPIDPKVARSSH